jgi:hypothetical protein
MSADADPAIGAVAVTPDVGIAPGNIRALYVGTPGNLVVITSKGETVTFTNVQGGSVLPIRVRQVVGSGTTAGSILALY